MNILQDKLVRLESCEMRHLPLAQRAPTVVIKGVWIAHTVSTSGGPERMPYQPQPVIVRLSLSGFSDQRCDLLAEYVFVTFAKAHVNGMNQAIAPNQIA